MPLSRFIPLPIPRLRLSTNCLEVALCWLVGRNLCGTTFRDKTNAKRIIPGYLDHAHLLFIVGSDSFEQALALLLCCPAVFSRMLGRVGDVIKPIRRRNVLAIRASENKIFIASFTRAFALVCLFFPKISTCWFDRGCFLWAVESFCDASRRQYACFSDDSRRMLSGPFGYCRRSPRFQRHSFAGSCVRRSFHLVGAVIPGGQFGCRCHCSLRWHGAFTAIIMPFCGNYRADWLAAKFRLSFRWAPIQQPWERLPTCGSNSATPRLPTSLSRWQFLEMDDEHVESLVSSRGFHVIEVQTYDDLSAF